MGFFHILNWNYWHTGCYFNKAIIKLNEKRRSNFIKIAQYLKSIIHFTKKTQVEMESILYKNLEEDKCYKEDCKDREIH